MLFDSPAEQKSRLLAYLRAAPNVGSLICSLSRLCNSPVSLAECYLPVACSASSAILLETNRQHSGADVLTPKTMTPPFAFFLHIFYAFFYFSVLSFSLLDYSTFYFALIFFFSAKVFLFLLYSSGFYVPLLFYICFPFLSFLFFPFASTFLFLFSLTFLFPWPFFLSFFYW